MKDELRDKIAILLDENDERLYHGKVTPKELADRILSLLAPELDKAKKYDALFPPAREVWEWQAEAERILYGKVGGYKDALEGKEGKNNDRKW